MQCRQFDVAVEEHFARHPDQVSGALPMEMSQHAVACRRCYLRHQTMLRSRVLLASLRAPATADPFFAARVRARIQAAQAAAAAPSGWRSLRVAAGDLVLASALMIAMLGSFLYNLNRTERPNADEAIALDVPHLNAQHPSDDHLRPRNSDVMVSLLNP